MLDEAHFHLMNILDGDNVGQCLQPCSQMKFYSRIQKSDPHEDHYGLYIKIEKKVLVQDSMFIINEVTLVTRIGGIIGVGKEFLWITILVLGIIIKPLRIVKRNGKIFITKI